MKVRKLIGQKFSRLTIIKISESFVRPNGKKDGRVIARCECGNEKEYYTTKLKSGHTQSCGCLHREMSSIKNVSHGMTNERIYSIYNGMIKRCNNENEPNFSRYGGRGIKCEFISFEHFLETMSPTYKDGLTIERKDVNGNYSPNNCTWATMKEQASNKTNTIWIEGVCLKDYCFKNGLSYIAVHHRINRGMDLKEALSKPFRKSPTKKIASFQSSII